jgi:long-chain acyl-CoA synthetase
VTTVSPRTIAQLPSLAADTFAGRPALRAKRDGDWRDTSYEQHGRHVRALALGLLGEIAPGDRVGLLSSTRPEWTLVDHAVTSAGGVVVPIYATSSPDECEWVLHDSGATVVVCEDAAQAAKIGKVRGRLPELRRVVVIDGDGGGGQHGDADATVAELAERGAAEDGGPAADELSRRREAVQPDDPYTFVYTSGTTGRPKGCVLTHANLVFLCELARDVQIIRPGDVVYLYLPLAHVFARIVELAAATVGATMAYFGGDTSAMVAELGEVRPTYLPSVPRIFEKLYTLATAQAASPEAQERLRQAVAVGVQVRDLEVKGEPVPDDMRAAFATADAQMFSGVRSVFGGQVRECTTGAAPIAPEILEFFYAAGVPVFEGYGMTESTGVATVSTAEHHRFGSVGRAAPGVEMRVADDGELLIRGGNVFAGYHGNAAATGDTLVDGWLHTGDLGVIDDDGYIRITGRIKDIIITAGGKNLTPANLENDLKTSRWISQAVMHGDRRPYAVALITLDEEEILAYAREHGLPDDVAELSRHATVRELIQGVVDAANAAYAPVEQIKRFHLLDHDLTQDAGELTPTLKLKRNVVNDRYAAVFDALYTGAPAPSERRT